jgi:hypothetical protein
VAMNEFCNEISKKYDIDVEEINSIWINMKQFKGITDYSTQQKKKRKTSAYIHFTKAERPNIISENPEAKFGEISKLISQKWKNMSSDEKKVYEEKSVTDVSPVKTNKKFSVKQLRELCKKKGLDHSGTKIELLRRLDEDDDESSSHSDSISSIHSKSSMGSLKSSDSTICSNDTTNKTIKSDVSLTKYSKMKLCDIKNICKEKKISTKGNKQELIQRLLES